MEYTWKFTSKLYLKDLYHPEDDEFVKVVKRFFYISPDFVAIPWALKEQAN
jgi:hypothetical protein